MADNAWQEVYVHSKVTIMDDTFTIISSANLNTRSMEKDTELGIIYKQARSHMIYANGYGVCIPSKNAAANPDGMHDYNVAKQVFAVWKVLLDDNRKAKKEKSSKPLYPLRQFFRPNPTVSRKD